MRKAANVLIVKKGLGCKNCGEEQELVFPIRMDFYSESVKAFERLHKKCKPKEAGKKRFEFSTEEEEWYRSWDTGISSETIYHVFTGKHVRSFGVPIDPSDFGRCHRLLQKFPQWRASLSKVAEKFPEWGPLVEQWDTLETLYVEDLPSGTCPRLYEAMQPLVESGRSKAIAGGA